MEQQQEKEFFEFDLTLEEKNLFIKANKQRTKNDRFRISNPKLSIVNLGNVKKIMLMPNESWWGIVIYQTKRQKPITEKEARRKFCKWLNIVLWWSSL